MESLTVYRGDTDRYGNPNKTVHGTVQGVLSWGSTQPSTPVGGRGENASTGAELYVPRGVDVKARDRIERASGDTYRVVGGAQWDQDHPVTNRNFGWVVYRLEAT
ncbi:hypothetical protein [Mycolicibacterium palauense]|uniref:hypothetical protein n=1 Tax=Mycolicibacterium palauense TaxID=2034511 RepID=UPI000BFF18C2|nr:hypothetical protein [Mycolicibacterium palauense]